MTSQSSSVPFRNISPNSKDWQSTPLSIDNEHHTWLHTPFYCWIALRTTTYVSLTVSVTVNKQSNMLANREI
jgi:hypothetical protein